MDFFSRGSAYDLAHGVDRLDKDWLGAAFRKGSGVSRRLGIPTGFILRQGYVFLEFKVEAKSKAVAPCLGFPISISN